MRCAPVTLLIIALLAGNGELQAVCPNTTIEAEEGDTVTLPCYLHPEDSVVNRTFDWSRDDLNKRVYVRRQNQENHHEQMDQYKNRTTVNLEDLRKGIMTLQISSVQLNDSGQYKCFVPTLWTGCFVNVTVREQDHQSKKKLVANTTRRPTDEPGKPDGEKWKLEIIIPIGILVPIGILGLFGTVVLVRRGTIPNPITRFRGRRGQKAELTNGTELNPLRTSSANAGPDPDDSNNLQVV